MDPNRFLTNSLRALPAGKEIAAVMAAALEAVDPADAVRRFMRRTGPRLYVGEREYNLDACDRVCLIGAGKAVGPMARAAAEILGPHLEAGLAITKDGYAGEAIAGVTLLEAGHPVPDARGVQAARRLGDLLNETTAQDLVVCLLSGGGSALLTQPAAGLELADLQALTQALLAGGAAIQEINTLRKHLEQFKGGQLARQAAPAPVVSLILSDVVGDPLAVIASGPTAPDPTTFQQAQAILERHDLLASVPPAIRQHLQAGCAGELPETPKPGDPVFANAHNIIIGSNRLAAAAALARAAQAGFHPLLLTTYLEGEARQAGPFLASLLRQAATSDHPQPRPVCLAAGGETTVTLHGQGLGGRNQELALSAVVPLAGLPGVVLVTLATDGGDGPTDAAGAVVTGETLTRAQALGLDPDDFLHRNDAYHFFAPLGDLLRPGPTLTNVNDLTLLFTLDR